MTTKMKVVCPKCKAKLKFDPDKITSDVVKFKCPGCASVLSIRKPSPQKEISSSAAAGRSEGKTGKNMRQSGTEFLDMAGRYGEDVDSAGDDEAEEPEEIGSEAGPAAGEGPESSEMKKNHDGPVMKTGAKKGMGIESRNLKRVTFKKKVLVNKQIMVEALDISEETMIALQP